MNWIRDAAAKREQQERIGAQEAKLKAQRWEYEASTVRPLVMRLLKDLGRVVYGRRDWFFIERKFQISEESVGYWKLYTGSYARSFYGVSFHGGERPHFVVQHGGGDTETTDASEAELKRALIIAFEKGTQHDTDYDN